MTLELSWKALGRGGPKSGDYCGRVILIRDHPMLGLLATIQAAQD